MLWHYDGNFSSLKLRRPILVQHESVPVHKVISIKTSFAKVDVEELKWSAQNHDLNLTEHLWDDLELESPYPTPVFVPTNALVAKMNTNTRRHV